MYKLSPSVYGSQPTAEFFNPDLVQRHQAGMRVSGIDPYWGGGDFVYGMAAGTQEAGSVCIASDIWTMSDYPITTANLGFPVFIALHAMTASEWGWYQVSGMAVLSASASVAVDTPVGLTTAGQVGAATAGRNLLGYRNRLPSSTIVAKPARVVAGSPVVKLTSGNVSGWFHGITLVNGGAFTAGTTLIAFNQNQREVTASTNGLSSGFFTISGTYTGYIAGVLNHPCSNVAA